MSRSTGSCTSRLMRSDDLGRSWTDITPPGLGRGTAIDAVVFRRARWGWVTAEDCASGAAWLYGTADGGRIWHRTDIDPRSCNSGAQVDPDFVDPHHGWLLHVEPTAPFATLTRTSGRGRALSATRGLPDLGAIEFVDRHHGWFGGGGFAWGRLWATDDGGVSWRRTRPPVPSVPRGATVAYDLPTFFGPRRGVIPISIISASGRAAVVFDGTTDGGRTWTVLAGHMLGRVPYRRREPVFPPAFPTGVASPTTWWVLAGRPATAYVTADGGRSWSAARTGIRRPRTISAVSARVAWLVTFGPDGGLAYRTTDRGRSWVRLRVPASAA